MALPTAAILPSGRTKFTNNAGATLSGGTIAFYVPGGTTPKTTWEDPDQASANANPVTLDVDGGAVIYGYGQYRMLVHDSAGNTIFDDLTQDPLSLAENPAVLNVAGTMSVAGMAYLNGGLTGTGTLDWTGVVQLTGPVDIDGLATIENLIVDGNPNIPTVPIGQAGSTINVGSHFHGTTDLSGDHEFLVSIEFVNTQGGTLGNKVSLYAAMDITNGASGFGWVENLVLLIEPGGAPAGATQIFEHDLAQNSGTEYSAGIIASGFASPSVLGGQITGNGTKPATAALGIFGFSTTGPLWQVGIAFANNSVGQATILDENSVDYSYVLQGVKDVGFDAAGPPGVGLPAVFTTSMIRAGAQQPIVAVRKQDNSADMKVLQSTGLNQLLVGDTPANGMSAVLSQSHFYPVSDNVLSLGDTTHRWTEVWAANGAIQTSDPGLKTNIRKLSELSNTDLDAVITGLEPVVFQWTHGGFDSVEKEVEVEEQEFEEIETSRKEFVLGPNGWIEKMVPTISKRLLWDHYQLHGEDGLPLFDVKPAVEAVFDENGKLVQRARPEMKIPKMHRVPRMGKVKKKVVELVPREGRRNHVGFLADQVEEVVQKGLPLVEGNFGGFVRASDGTLAIRPDQLVPFLWEKVRRLSLASSPGVPPGE